MADELKQRLRGPLDETRRPSGGMEDVKRRARARQGRRRVVLVAVISLVVALGVALPLAGLRELPGGPQPEASGARTEPGVSSTVVDAYGIQFAIPSDWSSAVYAVKDHPRPTVRAATFPLPAADDALATEARTSMSGGDVLISFEEHTAVCPPCEGFAEGLPNDPLRSADFSDAFDYNEAIVEGGILPPTRNDIPESHAFARRIFSSHHRYIELWIEFGQDPPPAEVLGEVDAILASVTVGPFRPPQQPDGACNSFSLSSDPDCANNQWIDAILALTPYQLADDPDEMTPYAEGAGTSFFIQVEEANLDLPPADWPVFAVVNGVQVYGDEEGLIWEVQGRFIRISPGPDGTASLPDEAGLRELVSASSRAPYPK